MIKKTDEHPDEEIHRVRNRRVQEQKFLHLWSWVLHPPDEDAFAHLEAERYWDFVEASLCKHDQLLTPFPAPLSSVDGGGLRLKIPSINHKFGLSGDQPSPRSHPESHPESLIRTEYAPTAFITYKLLKF